MEVGQRAVVDVVDEDAAPEASSEGAAAACEAEFADEEASVVVDDAFDVDDAFEFVVDAALAACIEEVCVVAFVQEAAVALGEEQTLHLVHQGQQHHSVVPTQDLLHSWLQQEAQHTPVG